MDAANTTPESARTALDRHAWEEAAEAFAEVDRREPLPPEDLERWAEASWWCGRPDDAIELLERAYTEYLREERGVEAAMVALRLSVRAMRAMNPSVGQGWLAQAERILAGEPESVGHAWLHALHAVQAAMVLNDPDGCIAASERAIELGRRHGDRDVVSLAMSFQAGALLKKGRYAAGLALFDEASAAATSGELQAHTACDVYCLTIAACSELGDYRRAEEWTERAERWMERQSIRGYVGICRVHRAELKRLWGWWSEAEQEALRACEELERFRLLDGLGFANYEIGEVRLHRGDLDGAEEAFARAYEYGHDAQPGLSLLLLERGEVEEARATIERALAATVVGRDPDEGADRLARARLLPALVEIALAAGDLSAARDAASELDEIAGEYEARAWKAGALTARGAVLLDEGDPEGAVPLLTRAWRTWQEVDLPYETARARTLLARARMATGDERGARLELRAARSIFERLGAAGDLQRLVGMAGDEPGEGSGRLRLVRTFMFTDIVGSTDLAELMGDGAWEEVLRWHDRELRAAFARHGGEEVRHTGDGFFVAFADPGEAVECAVEIQRRLAEHRRRHGFAPWVRIGLHTAEATRQGADYAGHGVHTAARIGDLGGREEIVASAAVLEAAGPIRFPVDQGRPATLKGVAQPVDVHTVAWR